MRTILILFLLFPFIVTPQDKILDRELFEFTNDGLKPLSLKVEVDGVSSEELYFKAIKWLEETDNSIKDCTIKLKSNTKNEKITISGHLDFYLCEFTKKIKFKCYDTRFTIDLLFSDGSYSINPKSLKYEANNKTLCLPIKLNKKSKTIYKSDGTVRRSFIYFPSTIKTIFNVIDISF